MREILEAAVLFAMLDNTRIKYLILLFVTTNYQSLAGNDSVKADYQMCRRDRRPKAVIPPLGSPVTVTFRGI
jgi:hypothetical protein